MNIAPPPNQNKQVFTPMPQKNPHFFNPPPIFFSERKFAPWFALSRYLSLFFLLEHNGQLQTYRLITWCSGGIAIFWQSTMILPTRAEKSNEVFWEQKLVMLLLLSLLKKYGFYSTKETKEVTVQCYRHKQEKMINWANNLETVARHLLDSFFPWFFLGMILGDPGTCSPAPHFFQL